MYRVWSIILGINLLFLFGCKEAYYPDLAPNQSNFLVVEGFISNGDSATYVRLSRTVALNDTSTIKPERNAVVTVEGEDNTTYPLQEQTAGMYRAGQLQLDASKKYRLSIKTSNGNVYASEFLTLNQTPPLEVTWERGANGVNITFSSSGLQNTARYYLWNFEETWEVVSHYEARYKYNEGRIITRDAAEAKSMFQCWKTNKPTVIRLISTVSLQQNVIEREPVVFIPEGHEKLDVRYSILVRQYALDKQAYEFYQLMKKNTESLGTLFDPQPSDIAGNIKSLSNPSEKVIGFVAASAVQEQRIFISKDDVPDWKYNPGCITEYVLNEPEALSVFDGDELVPFLANGFIPILGYFGVPRHCADCRTNGGRNERPAYW